MRGIVRGRLYVEGEIVKRQPIRVEWNNENDPNRGRTGVVFVINGGGVTFLRNVLWADERTGEYMELLLDKNGHPYIIRDEVAKRLGKAERLHIMFDDEARSFSDFFAETQKPDPAPEPERKIKFREFL